MPAAVLHETLSAHLLVKCRARGPGTVFGDCIGHESDNRWHAQSQAFVDRGRDIAHPESAELHLARAESLRALGDPESALAAAEKTLALLTAAGDEMSGAATHARSLIAELEAETRQRAAGM